VRELNLCLLPASNKKETPTMIHLVERMKKKLHTFSLSTLMVLSVPGACYGAAVDCRTPGGRPTGPSQVVPRRGEVSDLTGNDFTMITRAGTSETVKLTVQCLLSSSLLAVTPLLLAFFRDFADFRLL